MRVWARHLHGKLIISVSLKNPLTSKLTYTKMILSSKQFTLPLTWKHAPILQPTNRANRANRPLSKSTLQFIDMIQFPFSSPSRLTQNRQEYVRQNMVFRWMLIRRSTFAASIMEILLALLIRLRVITHFKLRMLKLIRRANTLFK